MKFCDRPFKFAYLTRNGEVWPCGWMHYAIGNLYEQNLDEIWHSPEAEKARQSVMDGSFAYCRKQSCPFLERGDLPELTEEARRTTVPTEVPEQMNLANERTCNIACTNCRTCVIGADPEERRKIDVALERLLPFANQLQSLSMNGGGEFLAIPSNLDLLQKLRPVRPDFELSLESNGVLFDEAHWRRFSHLSKYRIHVTVTVNSLRREVYRYLSGGFDHLDRVLDNLRFLSRLRRENQIYELNVTPVLQEANFWEFPDYVRRFAESDEFAVDQIIAKPLYNWWGMARETYWFKNIFNPRHPYHKEYLRILADDCWKNPKVYDWGCHNLREERDHPLAQAKEMSDLLLKLYAAGNPAERLRNCLERISAHRLAIYGESEHLDTILGLLRAAGAEVVLRLMRFTDAPGDPPTVSMPHFDPASVDAVLLLELYDQQNRINNLRSLNFHGPVLNLKELTETP